MIVGLIIWLIICVLIVVMLSTMSRKRGGCSCNSNSNYPLRDSKGRFVKQHGGAVKS